MAQPAQKGFEARLIVHGPDGEEHQVIELADERITVGRLPGLNDIALAPDPQKRVTRQEHCAFERDGSSWFVVDTGSVNGTFIRRAGERTRVSGRAELMDGDAVCIVAGVSDDRQPSYWELTFDDRGRTIGVSISLEPACISYDETEVRCYVVQGNERQEISLRPQAHRLVRHMAERNAAAGGTPVLCEHEELMKAVWADEPMHTREELNKLFYELRKMLEPFGADAIFENERGIGYRMRSCP
jgi:DNA-binding winged helix-turn-helix (wHTH) protein